ncbi:MAG: circadian clock protein KaiC [Myxococcota bacterium]
MGRGIEKSATGISGFDELTGGGLPTGRPTLVCGSAGCGKTMFAMEFLVRGATSFDEPGAFIAFEENADELVKNGDSLGFDLDGLQERGLLAIDHVHVDRSEIEETGEYDLEALFIRIGYAIDSIGAKRVVLDTIEALFAALPNEFVLRSELRRLFRWLKDRGVTVIITAERGSGTYTRHGLEEYVSDCVVLLDHRVNEQVSTRRLRVVKYRGSSHGTNEYPFIIGSNGFSVLPITSIGLDHPASNERVSSGVPRLDEMLGGTGFYKGSSVLVSGPAGTGKTTLAAHFAAAAASRGERCLYFAFEESPQQLVRNMRTIGIDLHTPIESGLLRMRASRPTLHGLETHLAVMHREIDDFQPDVVVVDPITNLLSIGSSSEVKAMIMRLMDFMKQRGITAFLNNLSSPSVVEQTEIGLSSLIDTWLLVRDLESNGERNRGLYVLKSRGMHHSNQVREFVITAKGVDLLDVKLAGDQVLVGSARVAHEERARARARELAEGAERERLAALRKRRALEAQIAALQAELEVEENAALDEYTRRVATDRAAESEQAGLAALRQRGSANGVEA